MIASLKKPFHVLRDRGVGHVAQVLLRLLILGPPRLLALALFKTILRHRTFHLDDNVYVYSSDTYNWTWATERAIEVPFFWRLVRQYSDKNVLEVGNVLAHYHPIEHEVVDKYESAARVINEDIVTYRPDKKYDLIISVSTLEHVGYHDYTSNEYEPGKILDAIQHLQRLLNRGGSLVFSFPKGYNSELEGYIENNQIAPRKTLVLRRSFWINNWRQCPGTGLECVDYNSFWKIAWAVVILTLDRQ